MLIFLSACLCYQQAYRSKLGSAIISEGETGLKWACNSPLKGLELKINCFQLFSCTAVWL